MMIRTKLVLAALMALVALSGCGNNGGPAPPPAGGLQLTPGDSYIQVSWADDPAINWWLFVSTDPALTTENFTTLTDIRIFRSARSPYFYCGQPNGAALYFAMNGRTDSGPGGPGSPTVTATTRAAGTTWTASTGLAGDFNDVRYGPLTGCSAAGLGTGIFVTVGANAAIATSTDFGRTFAASSAPAGFTTDLYGVTSVPANFNTTTATLTLVAVGAGGAVVTSADGVTWNVQIPFNAGSAALRSVANSIVSGVVTYYAVGDAGTVMTSGDGVTWTVRTSNTTANLRSVACTSGRCIAVGDNGTIIMTVDSGVTWTVQPASGTPAFKRVGYGNLNNNYVNNQPPSNIFINTWVALGDAGVVQYSVDDGATWTATSVAGAGDFTAIAYTTQFVAVDSAGNAFTSVDGQTWTGPFATGQTGLRALGTSGLNYVSVGTGGHAAVSF